MNPRTRRLRRIRRKQRKRYNAARSLTTYAKPHQIRTPQLVASYDASTGHGEETMRKLVGDQVVDAIKGKSR
jgi:hypothetical protein